MSHNSQILLFSGMAIVLWGLWGFLGKLALERKMAPATIFLAEVFVSALCALPVLLFLIRREDDFPPHVSWNLFGVFSGACLALGLLFYYLALEKGQVSIIVPLTAIYPIIPVLLGFLVLNERPTLLQWAGVILVVAGAVLLVSGPLAR